MLSDADATDMWRVGLSAPQTILPETRTMRAADRAVASSAADRVREPVARV